MSSKPRLSPRSPGRSPPSGSDSLQPWQLFTLAGLLGATITVFLSRGQSPAAVIILSLAVFAAAAVGIAALRTVMPLTSKAGRTARRCSAAARVRCSSATKRWCSGRSRSSNSIARWGRSRKDFAEMSGRLRARAARLLRQLDAGAGYRADRTRDRTSAWKAPLSRACAHRAERTTMRTHVSARDAGKRWRRDRDPGFGLWALGARPHCATRGCVRTRHAGPVVDSRARDSGIRAGDGMVTVRVVREAIGNNIAGQQVRSRSVAAHTATTDEQGRANSPTCRRGRSSGRSHC